MAEKGLFQSFFIGGFECSTHRPRSGRWLDLIAATEHDRCACADYARLREQGILTARDGIRWHLIGRRPGCYDFSSALPMVRAAHDAGVQLEGICIYPIVNFPWWDDFHLQNGLWNYPNEAGEREIYKPLARELQAQQRFFERVRDQELPTGADFPFDYAPNSVEVA